MCLWLTLLFNCIGKKFLMVVIAGLLSFIVKIWTQASFTCEVKKYLRQKLTQRDRCSTEKRIARWFTYTVRLGKLYIFIVMLKLYTQLLYFILNGKNCLIRVIIYKLALPFINLQSTVLCIHLYSMYGSI